MSTQLLDDVKRFLPELEMIQDEFSAHFEEKTAALRSAHSADILRLAESEERLVARLQSQLDRRSEILSRARQHGLPAESLERLTESIAGDDRQPLKEQIDRARRKSEWLRRESWIHWIVAHRTFTHYAELLEFIAHGGKTAPTYGDHASKKTTGAAILDASI